MSYKISYGETDRRTAKRQKTHFLRPAMAVLIIATAIALRLFYPEETKKLTETLFPLTSASSQKALEVFSQNIKAGESFGDAVTAFCLEIIDEADIT